MLLDAFARVAVGFAEAVHGRGVGRRGEGALEVGDRVVGTKDVEVIADAEAELPPYRLPNARSLALAVMHRAGIFLRRAGTIIFAVTVILWVLTQFPRTPDGPPPIEASALGQMGQVLEPAIEPLGFDWRVGVGLVSSLAAREVIVGTLGTIYGVEDASETSLSLQDNLQSHLDLGAAIGLLIFFAFALQCMSTVAVMRRETAGWKWPALQFGYMLALAYLASFVVYRTAVILGAG